MEKKVGPGKAGGEVLDRGNGGGRAGVTEAVELLVKTAKQQQYNSGGSRCKKNDGGSRLGKGLEIHES